MQIIPNVYKIDKSHWQLKDFAEITPIIKFIINTHNFKNGIPVVIDDGEISSFQKDNVTYYLYLYNSEERNSDWADFLPNELTGAKNFLQQKISLLLFILAEDVLYVVVGGNAYQIVVSFIDHSFGLNIYERIIQTHADELTSIKSRGITGQRIGINEQFRDEYRLINYIKFGKLPQELHVKLSSYTTDLHFSFLKSKQAERIRITAGKAFKITKPVNFDLLHALIKELVVINEVEPSDYLSSYKEIVNYDDINNNLRPLLIDKLYDHIAVVERTSNDPNDRFDFDFCHPSNIEKFYEAEEYHLKELTAEKTRRTFAKVYDRTEIYETVIKQALQSIGGYDKFKFKIYLQGVRVASVRGSKTTCAAPFLYHISTEFSLNDRAVFLIDTKWYNLKESFIKDLKISAQHIFKEFKAPSNILLHRWDKTVINTEKEYNLLYNGQQNYIVLDTIIVDGIELCDLIYYDQNNLYLIHVKYGFGSNMRELTNQILISAKRLTEARGTVNLPFIEKVYDKLVAKGHSVNNLILADFKALFNKKIIYVLATTSHLIDDLIIEDNIERFDSNIARFSITQCSSEMRTTYFDMLTYQIPRV